MNIQFHHFDVVSLDFSIIRTIHFETENKIPSPGVRKLKIIPFILHSLSLFDFLRT